MRMIHDAMKLSDPEEIRQEIAERQKLMHHMVGSLYPSIMQDEINKLKSREQELTTKEDEA